MIKLKLFKGNYLYHIYRKDVRRNYENTEGENEFQTH